MHSLVKNFPVPIVKWSRTLRSLPPQPPIMSLCPSVFAAVSSSALELEVACHTVGAWVLSVPRVTAPRDLLPPPKAPWNFIKLLLRGRLRGGPS